MPEISIDHYQTLVSWFVGLHNRIMTRPQFEPLRPFYEAEPEQMTDLNACRDLHRQAMWAVRGMFNERAQKFAISAIDEFVRQDWQVPPAPLIDDPEVGALCGSLAQRGHVSLPPAEAQIVADMKAYFDGEPVYPGSYVADDERCTIKEARRGNFASYPLERVFACPHLVGIANHPRTLAVVERYLNTAPTILGYSAWWSFAGPAQPLEAQLFHFDFDDYRFVKLFVYLTDVGPDDGPHNYVECSHDMAYVSAIREAWPGGLEEFDEWFFKTLRKTDDDVKRHFNKDPIAFTGVAGTQFLADTSGVHKGTPPEKSDRLVCQVLYGVSQYWPMYVHPLRMGTPETSHLPDWIGDPPYNYVNRLFLEPA